MGVKLSFSSLIAARALKIRSKNYSKKCGSVFGIVGLLMLKNESVSNSMCSTFSMFFVLSILTRSPAHSFNEKSYREIR